MVGVHRCWVECISWGFFIRFASDVNEGIVGLLCLFLSLSLTSSLSPFFLICTSAWCIWQDLMRNRLSLILSSVLMSSWTVEFLQPSHEMTDTFFLTGSWSRFLPCKQEFIFYWHKSDFFLQNRTPRIWDFYFKPGNNTLKHIKTLK